MCLVHIVEHFVCKELLYGSYLTSKINVNINFSLYSVYRSHTISMGKSLYVKLTIEAPVHPQMLGHGQTSSLKCHNGGGNFCLPSSFIAVLDVLKVNPPLGIITLTQLTEL
jgi:hypothetical protein